MLQRPANSNVSATKSPSVASIASVYVIDAMILSHDANPGQRCSYEHHQSRDQAMLKKILVAAVFVTAGDAGNKYCPRPV
jgi:hypothetical protein